MTSPPDKSYFVVVEPSYGDVEITSGPRIAPFTIEHSGQHADPMDAIAAALEMLKNATWGGGNCEVPAALRVEVKEGG